MKTNTTAEDIALVEKWFPALKGKITEPQITTLVIARQREAEAQDMRRPGLERAFLPALLAPDGVYASV